MKPVLQNPLVKEFSKPVLYLTAFALLGTLLLAGINAATKTRIADNERQALLQRLEQLLAGQSYNNNPLQDRTTLLMPMAGTSDEMAATVYRLRQQKVPVAAVYDLITPNGYSGSIRLVIGIDNQQRISGVRVVSHRETPGLGDKIELAKDDWILSFNGKSLNDPQPAKWAVKKDGGIFDQFTGATITPRAIVNTVRDVLHWSAQHQQRLFEQAPTTPDFENNPLSTTQ